MDQAREKNGAEIIVDCLKAEGVEFVFGVIGSAILDFLDVIYRTPEIRYIRAQHEQGAAFMADGYARITGRTGICTATCGPGITNMVTGIAGAYNESSPVIAISGDIHTQHYGKGPSNFHEINQENLFRPITKMSKRIENVEQIGEFMRMAFRTAQSGRKGPVYLGVPRNIQKEKARDLTWSPSQYRSEAVSRGDPATIVRACELLFSAKSPAMLVGGGVRWSGAEREILQLAETAGVPVTCSHKGLVAEDHPWSAGVVGMVGYPAAMEAVAKADVILALGCTFNQVTTASYTNRVIPDKAKIIQVDIDPLELGRNFPIHTGIVGDLKAVCREMDEKMKAMGPGRGREDRLQTLVLAKENWEERLLAEGATSDATPINRLRLMRDLNQALDRNAILSAESGSTHGWFYYGFKAYGPVLEPGDLSCMGSAWCMAMGAKAAFPDRQVVSVIGDGAFMMTLNELATAVDNKLPVVVIVENNGIYGNVRRKQIEHFDSRFAGSELYIPDLARVAQAFGAFGERVVEPGQIIPALERAFASGKPAVLDVVVDASWESLEPEVKLRVKDRY
ncbi:MAG: thiamine pyrophosphate-binding protein [Desulfobacterales bacterium]|nr:thiamine pyrophosphate-binding protein [Desulfobacterales bacterium]